MNKKNVAKLLSTFIGITSVFTPMFILTGCPQPTTPVVTEEEKNNVTLAEGIADWNDFKNRSFEYTTLDDGSISVNLLSVDNISDIKGFSGYASYKEIEEFLNSDIYNNKKYDTKNLDIHFEYVAEDGQGDEITPTILESILKNFTNLNISNIDYLGNKNLIKFSSGTAPVDPSDEIDMFDIDFIYDAILSNRISLPQDAKITQSKNAVNVIGVKDPYLSDAPSFSSEKLFAVLNHPLFVNSQIGKVTITGDLKKVIHLIDREYASDNISFNKDSYYKSNDGEIDNINFDDFQDLSVRGNKSFEGINVKADSSVLDANLNLSESYFKNVEFSENIDLSTVEFNDVNSEGYLIFKSILPLSMKNLTADNLIFDGATAYDDNDDTTPIKPTEITSKNGIKILEVKSLINPSLISSDKNSVIEKFKGTEDMYNLLNNNVFIIKGKDTIIITYLINNLRQNSLA